MTIPLRQLAFWNLCQGPGAFFLTLAIRKPCLRPPARCTTSKDLAKASEFWSILTGLKIFEMIRAGATVKTYIEDHWRLGLNTSRNSSENLNTSGQILWPRFRFRPNVASMDMYRQFGIPCTTLHYIVRTFLHASTSCNLLGKNRLTKLNKSRLCSKPDQAFWQLTLAQSRAENRWTLRWAAMDGKKVLAAAVAPWFDRPREYRVRCKNVLKWIKMI